jgi:outer membrane protein
MKLLARPLLQIALAAGLGLAGQSAFAQAFDAVRIYGAAPAQSGGIVALAGVFGHQYMGSDERRNQVFPGVDYMWTNGFFAGTTNGIGMNFSNRPDFSYGLRLTADFGRKEHRSDALKGMGDIDARPEFGGFLNYSLNQNFVLISSLRYGSGNDRKGLQADLGAAYRTGLGADWDLGVGMALTLANAELMQSNFGVTAAQAKTSKYAAYSPGSGLRDVRANISLTYHISPRIGITGALSASALQGDAKDSPLTREANPVNGVLALTYLF